MKQVFSRKGKISIHDVPPPVLSCGQVLVQVHYSCISAGTELATIAAGKGPVASAFAHATTTAQKVTLSINEHGLFHTLMLAQGKLHHHQALGYSCSGRVIDIGEGVEGLAVGDYVACSGSGIAYHAEKVVVSKNLVTVLPSNTHLKEASLVAVGAIAIHALRRADLKMGETVCVIGLGLIGHLLVQLSKHAGCTVIGVDVDSGRVEQAKRCGVDYGYNVNHDDIEREIAYKTAHHGVDATIITAPSSTGTIINQALTVTRRRGKVVMVGNVKLDFSRELLYEKEIDFLISCSYGPGRYDRAYEQKGIDYPYAYVRWTEQRNMQLFLDLIQKGCLQLDEIIRNEYTIEHASKAFDDLKQRKVLCAILSYNQQHLPVKNSQSILANISHSKKKRSHAAGVRVGVIGVGGFAKVMLLPTLAKIRSVSIGAVFDVDAARALSVAKQYHAIVPSGGIHELLADETIDAVIIASPHDAHFQQSLHAMKAGKSVFVEKPAVVNQKELTALAQCLTDHPDALYCVDFNRPHAPLITTIKKAINDRATPLMIHYRMNAGFLAQNHWVHDRKQGGRIIGEACHIFELFCFLTGSEPVSVSVNVLKSNHSDIAMTSNSAIDIEYADGSVCSLLYTDLGNKGMGKERMEIFFDGISIVMNDYDELSGFGMPVSFNKKLARYDKGHCHLMEKFIAAVALNGPSPVPFERVALAAKLSFVADSLARKGGGSVLLQNEKEEFV